MNNSAAVRHVGALSAMFADGALGWTYPGEDVLVMWTGRRSLPRDEGEPRPGSDIVGWIQWCSCGWWGRLWTRVPEPGQQDLADRRVYSAHHSPPRSIEDLAGAEWFAHMDGQPVGD
jgi:hypothetical protein